MGECPAFLRGTVFQRVLRCEAQMFDCFFRFTQPRGIPGDPPVCVRQCAVEEADVSVFKEDIQKRDALFFHRPEFVVCIEAVVRVDRPAAHGLRQNRQKSKPQGAGFYDIPIVCAG